MSLQALIERGAVWRGDTTASPASMPAVSTGHGALDRRLPGRGWPLGALTEILLDEPGIGELQLVLPALADTGRRQRLVAWVDPPLLPYPPGLAAAGLDLGRLLRVRTGDAAATLWALEQLLRSGACGAVLGWPRQPDNTALRRLQLAAETGNALAFLFRPRTAADQASPAALRLTLAGGDPVPAIRILKARGGGRTSETIRLAG